MGWRDELKIHPACERIPPISHDELLALSADIRINGLQERVKLIIIAGIYMLLDGRSRLDALEMFGPIQVFTGNSPNNKFFEVIVPKVDPVVYALSVNLHRRHLTPEQKRELIENLLKANPEFSDRFIASATKVSDKTVGARRHELEGRAEIPHVAARTDTTGRRQPARKKVQQPKAPPEKLPDSEPTLFDTSPPVAPDASPERKDYAAPSTTPAPPLLIDPWAGQRAAARGSIRGLAKLKDVDFGPVAATMTLEQLREASDEIDEAIDVALAWSAALDAAIERATSVEDEASSSDHLVREQDATTGGLAGEA
jgi:hypothetical protein